MFSLTLRSTFIIIILMSFSANSLFSVISMSVSIYFFIPGYGLHFSLLCMSSNCLMIAGHFELYMLNTEFCIVFRIARLFLVEGYL